MARRKVVGKPNLLRLVNRNTILHLLENQRVTSRAELAALSGLSPPTVSAVIRELSEEGWVNELGEGVSQGGKPPHMIGLNVDARVVASIQITADFVETRISNLANRVLDTETLRITSHEPRDISQLISRSIVQMLHQTRLPWEKVLGVCVSVPGVVDVSGTVYNAPELGWEGIAFADELSGLLQSEVLVQNDVKLAALGEAWARDFFKGTMVYVHLDRGIGAGILIDGKMYSGSHHAAGEIGGMVVSPETLHTQSVDRTPGQVAQGPFERNFGLQALLSQGPGVDRETHETNIINYLAYGLANVVSVLDPELVVFGGEVTRRVDDFLPKLASRLQTLPIVRPDMVLSELGREACFNGATRYVLDNFRAQVDLTSI